MHSEAPFSLSAGEYYDSLREQYMGIRPAPGTSWPLSFGHLSSYGAVYYTYVHCHGATCMLRVHAACYFLSANRSRLDW